MRPNKKKDPILVIDCASLLHSIRAVQKKLMAYNGGEDTSIIDGFFHSLLHLSEYFGTGKFVFCWDSMTSIRKTMFPAYKNRKRGRDNTPMEEEFDQQAFKQFDIIRDVILPKIGFTHNHMYEGYEADDIIAATVMENSNAPFIIISSDADMFQLLFYAPVYLHRKHFLMTKEIFKSMYGTDSTRWWEVKALAGCSSDTVPGIPRVGEKTAIKYLERELHTGTKAYAAIVSPEGKAIVERNIPLVRLPLPDCPVPNTRSYSRKLSKQAFVEVASEYGMFDLLDTYTLNKLCQLWGLQGE